MNRSTRRGTKRCLTGWICLCGLLLAHLGHSEETSLDLIKTGFIFNLAKFTTWPPSKLPAKDEPIRLVVLGNSGIKRHLEEIAKTKTVGPHPMIVDAELNPANTHIVFVGEKSEVDLTRLMSNLRGQGVLVISDHPKAFLQGVHIYLFIDKDRLAFNANHSNARADLLGLEAKVLSLAKEVIR